MAHGAISRTVSMGHGAGLERKLESPSVASRGLGDPMGKLPSGELPPGVCFSPGLWAQGLHSVGVVGQNVGTTRW